VLLQKAADFRLQQHNLISSNIANVNVPNYTHKSIEFEQQLQEAVRTKNSPLTVTDPDHIGKVQYKNIEGKVEAEFKPRTVHGQDSVDIDKEMTEMARNSFQFTALMTLIQKDFSGKTKYLDEFSK
jgi:flagellar basal-body rod protein FlgB